MGREKCKEDEDSSSIFKKGVAVEVSSEDEGLRGSWYTATVIKSAIKTTSQNLHNNNNNNNNNKILVEYHNLFANEQGGKKLQELVDPILIRPIPPNPVGSGSTGSGQGGGFKVMDDVDAYHHDGWWEGVVTRAFEGGCSVFFRCSREQIDFGFKDLRVHREWLGGNRWRPSISSSSSSGNIRFKLKTG